MSPSGTGQAVSADPWTRNAVWLQPEKKGLQKAECRICQRKALDWMSALVYLLTFRTADFKAVRKAYKEYRTLAKPIDVKDITEHITNSGTNVSVRGIYNKSIILQSMLKGKDVFRSIDI